MRQEFNFMKEKYEEMKKMIEALTIHPASAPRPVPSPENQPPAPPTPKALVEPVPVAKAPAQPPMPADPTAAAPKAAATPVISVRSPAAGSNTSELEAIYSLDGEVR